MKILILLSTIFILSSITTFSQEPQFVWGDKISRKFGQLENLEIVGVDKDGFFATYEANGQISLEHYNPENKRFWTTALLPKTPNGHSTDFYCVHLFDGKLYMFSSGSNNTTTEVYVQEINHNGNYTSEIIKVAEGPAGNNVQVALSKDNRTIAVAISNAAATLVTVTLLTDELTERWQQTFDPNGQIQELLVQNDGSTYVLAEASAAAPATSAFYLHQLLPESGIHSEIALGHSLYRPLKAMLATTPKGSVLVSGYMSPSNSVANQNPEPVGTFIYRVENHNLQDRFAAYTPFNRKFLRDYKRFKPDFDSSQRLRYLHLDKIIPLSDGGIYLLGEVCQTENRAGTFVYHNNDIIIVRLRKDGTAVFTTSINKLQSGTNSQNTIRSYFAAASQDTLKVIYLDFEYNYNFEDDIAMYSPKSSHKTPVMLTIYPNGKQNLSPLSSTQTGSIYGFYLRPCSAYKSDDKGYIIIGMGPNFYRYGRMTL